MAIDYDAYCQQRILELMTLGKFKAATLYAKMWGRWKVEQHASTTVGKHKGA